MLRDFEVGTVRPLRRVDGQSPCGLILLFSTVCTIIGQSVGAIQSHVNIELHQTQPLTENNMLDIVLWSWMTDGVFSKSCQSWHIKRQVHLHRVCFQTRLLQHACPAEVTDTLTGLIWAMDDVVSLIMVQLGDIWAKIESNYFNCMEIGHENIFMSIETLPNVSNHTFLLHSSYFISMKGPNLI